jgi:hypothetical protein
MTTSVFIPSGLTDNPVGLSFPQLPLLGGFMFETPDRVLRVIFLLALVVLALDLLVWRPL